MRSIIVSAILLAISTALPASAGSARAAEPDLRTKIGQMIMVGFVGTTPKAAYFRHVLDQIRDGKVGGVIYLQRNITGKTAVKAMNDAIIAAAGDNVPPLIAVDQEGGRVQRLTAAAGFHEIPSARSMAARLDPRTALDVYTTMARNLYDWGFNLNLGPVVDLNVNPRNPIIGRLGRSYSADPQTVIQYAAAFAEAHHKAGVLTALKHFPGHGSSHADSHDQIVDVTDTWSKAELEPFRELIRQGYGDMVMTAHVHNSHLEAPGDADPVSLSKRAIQGVLRGELGFRRVVISDDMQMAGVTKMHDLEQLVLRAVKAGTDILLFANDKHPDPDIPEKVADILAEAAQHDSVLRSRIDKSYQRIVKLRRSISMISPASTEPLVTRSIARAQPRPQRQVVVTPQVMAAMGRDKRLHADTAAEPAGL